MGKHAKLSPSSAYRWINCPGSIRLIEQCPPPKESPYALEGTLAHKLAERCLLEGVDAEVFKEVDGKKIKKDMAEAVQVYLDEIRSRVSFEELDRGTKILKVEEWFDVSFVHKDIYGTNDAFIFDPRQKHLSLWDYKNGVGVIVEPDWNPQLMIYALGAIHSIWKSQTEKTKKAIPAWNIVEIVDLNICQPRALGEGEKVKTWQISSKDLFYWGINVLSQAARNTEDPNARLCAGKHCKFCPAIAVCSEQVKQACAVAKVDFQKPVLPAPSELTENDIAKVMDFSELVSGWVKEVKAYAQELAERGVKIPGYKLVQKRAMRKWIDETEIGPHLHNALGEEAFERKVLSPAKAEKALKKAGLSPESWLRGLVIKESSGNTIVPESDKRKDVAPSAMVDFIDTADFLQ